MPIRLAANNKRPALIAASSHMCLAPGVVLYGPSDAKRGQRWIYQWPGFGPWYILCCQGNERHLIESVHAKRPRLAR